MIDLEAAARMGGSAGLLGEGEPAGLSKWPAPAQTAFAAAYARGRRTRRVAEGKDTITPSATIIPAGATREQLATQFQASDALRQEFGTVEAFVGFAMAADTGKARIIQGRIVSQ